MIGFGPWRMLGARADLLAGLLLGLALLPSEAIGALAPQYQRLAELRAILSAPSMAAPPGFKPRIGIGPWMGAQRR
jgi:hypothetical protein